MLGTDPEKAILWRRKTVQNELAAKRDHHLDAEGHGYLAALIQAGSPMALFHMHWQGLNPQTGLGWKAFQEMIDRLMSQFGDRIVWQRPSEIAAAFHEMRQNKAVGNERIYPD